MAKIDLSKNFHKAIFPSKVNSAMEQGGHIYNVTLINDHDNGDLVKRETTWVGFDRFNESATPVDASEFTGIVLGESTSNPGYWFVQVLTVADDVVLVYNSPISPYPQRELQDEKLFVNKTGDTVQGFELSRGDVFEVSANGFSGTLAVNAPVTFDATTKKYAI